MKIGLALGGGGVRGMAHVSVLRVLEAAHVPIDIIVGTSAGAIVGALYAAGKSPEEIQRVARTWSARKWFGRDSTGMGLFSTGGIRRVIDTALGEDVHIEDLPRKFACVAVDIDSQKQVVFESGPVADAVCASAAYPGLFAPVRIANCYYFDGGVLNPVPFDVARRLGADRVIASDLGAQEPFFAALGQVSLRPSNVLWQWWYGMSHQPIFRIVERSIGIMSQEIRDQRLKASPPDVMITPSVYNIGLLDFGLIEECFAAGEKATIERLTEIERVVQAPVKPRAWGKLAKRTFDWVRGLDRF